MGSQRRDNVEQALSRLKNRIQQSIWLTDLDDTLVNTAAAHAPAAKAMEVELAKIVSMTRARAIRRRFVAIFDSLIVGHQVRTPDDWASRDPKIKVTYDTLSARVAGCQQELAAKYGSVRMFSREVLLKLASDDEGISLTSTQLNSCATQYWAHMTSNIDFFDHAVELTHRIANQSVPLYIFTSSDARLQLADNGQFAYDPEVSRQLKASRLGSLRTRGLLFKSAFIGDPFDKPTSEFFDSIKSAVTQELGRFHGRDLVVMGDSFSADLNVPLTRWQADLGVWYRRGQEVPQVEGDHVLSIGSWHVLTAILEGQPMSN